MLTRLFGVGEGQKERGWKDGRMAGGIPDHWAALHPPGNDEALPPPPGTHVVWLEVGRMRKPRPLGGTSPVW